MIWSGVNFDSFAAATIISPMVNWCVGVYHLGHIVLAPICVVDELALALVDEALDRLDGRAADFRAKLPLDC